MLEIVAESGTQAQAQAQAQGQAGRSRPVAMIPHGHRITLPRRSGESRFAPQQYCYAASKSGVVPSVPLTASGPSQRDESFDVQRDAA